MNCTFTSIYSTKSDQTRTTTWLHPRSSEPVCTGHRKRDDLPKGWEEGFTKEGASYFINHNDGATSFKHPLKTPLSQDNTELEEDSEVFLPTSQPSNQLPSATHDKMDSKPLQYSSSLRSDRTTSYPTGRPIGKRSVLSMSQRGSKSVSNPGRQVSSQGNQPSRQQNLSQSASSMVASLDLQSTGSPPARDSTGMKLWKRRWFVLCDYCLFYYKDSKEDFTLGSISLPSFQISPVDAEDKINRRFAFKAMHAGMRTYYFAADAADEMKAWMETMGHACTVQNNGPQSVSVSELKPEMNHIPSIEYQPETPTLPPKPPNTPAESATEPITLSPPPSFTQEVLESVSALPSLAGRFPKGEDDVADSQPVTPAENINARSDNDPAVDGRVSSSLALPQSTQSRDKIGDALQVPTPRTRIAVSSSLTALNTTEGLGFRTLGGVRNLGDVGLAASQGSLGNSERDRQKRNSMLQLEQWVKSQKEKNEVDRMSIVSTQTLPRHMPSHRQSLCLVPILDGFSSLPRRPRRPGSVASADLQNPVRLPGTSDNPGGQVNTELQEWRQRQMRRHGTPGRFPVSSPPALYSMVEVDESGGFAVDGGLSHSASPRLLEASMLYHELSPRRGFSRNDRRSLPPSAFASPSLIPSSLQTCTAEELTLLLIQLRRSQASLAQARNRALSTTFSPVNHTQSLASAVSMQKNLRFIESQMKANEPLINSVQVMLRCGSYPPRKQVFFPESFQDRMDGLTLHPDDDIDTKLSSLCEQDQAVQELGRRLQQLKDEKEGLEQAAEKIRQELGDAERSRAARQGPNESLLWKQQSLQQRLVGTRADIARTSAELQRVRNEAHILEAQLLIVKSKLEQTLGGTNPITNQDRLKKDLWRIQDVLGGLEKSSVHGGEAERLGSSSLQNSPSRSLIMAPITSTASGHRGKRPDFTIPYSFTLPRHSSLGIGRNTSTQPALSNGDSQIPSESALDRVQNSKGAYPVGVVPPLPKSGTLALPSYVTLRRTHTDGTKERPKSSQDVGTSAGSASTLRGTKMSAEEQLTRLQNNQRASQRIALRARRKTVTLGATGSTTTSSRPLTIDGLQSFRPRPKDDLEIEALERALREDEPETPAQEIARLRGQGEATTPADASFAEEVDAQEPTSPAEEQEKLRRVQRIKSLVARSSFAGVPVERVGVHNQLEEQERIIDMSSALAVEASQKSRAKLSPTKVVSPPPQNTIKSGSHFAFV
uniref:pleckstrin homology domain-containing family A member 5-like isoform X3 n=1 Tax=Myxine glutinosa TaxID=7769 RepID=UPI00358E1144